MSEISERQEKLQLQVADSVSDMTPRRWPRGRGDNGRVAGSPHDDVRTSLKSHRFNERLSSQETETRSEM